MAGFGVRLHERMTERGRMCIGIDPHPALLHDWGLDDTVGGMRRFALTAAEAVGPVAAVVKPQVAFFERHGSRGVAVLEEVAAQCRADGALVLMDAKRGDIGSTSQAYADAFLDPSSPLAGDAVTLSPYLGWGSLEPFFAAATEHGAGVFVLALTSNPEADEVQSAVTSTGESVGVRMLRHLAEANGPGPEWGSHGAVVGATVNPPGDDLQFNGPILAPGVGAQGATIGDIAARFGGVADRVLPNSSRAILSHGPTVDAIRAACVAANDEARQLDA